VRGELIVFEGLDGSGTSTQAGRLRQWLVDVGHPVELTREPTSGPIGAAVRQAIEGRVVLDPLTLALAFAADRCDHTLNERSGIAAALEAGRWVVSDRYVLSSLAYQRSSQASLEWLAELNRWCLEPDLTIFVDTDPEVCLRRIAARSSNDELFHRRTELERIRRDYEAVLGEGRFVGHLVVVDGGGGEEEVFARLLPQVRPWMEERERAASA
jgi:dTMP kinase